MTSDKKTPTTTPSVSSGPASPKASHKEPSATSTSTSSRATTPTSPRLQSNEHDFIYTGGRFETTPTLHPADPDTPPRFVLAPLPNGAHQDRFDRVNEARRENARRSSLVTERATSPRRFDVAPAYPADAPDTPLTATTDSDRPASSGAATPSEDSPSPPAETSTPTLDGSALPIRAPAPNSPSASANSPVENKRKLSGSDSDEVANKRAAS